MRLWMIVAEPAVRALERQGGLVADGRRTPPDFRRAYRWMATQMAARVGPPPRPGAFPLWAGPSGWAAAAQAGHARFRPAARRHRLFPPHP